MDRRNFIKGVFATGAIAVTPFGTAPRVLLQGERFMKTTSAPMTFPETLVLRNPDADYYFKMKFEKKVSVQVVREPKKQYPCSFECLPLCANTHAVFLRGISVRAQGPEAVLDATTVTVALDGERIVDRLPIRKAEKLEGQDFLLEEKRTDLFQALTMEKKMVGMFMPNATHVVVDIFRPDPSQDGGLVVEMLLDMAEYVSIKVPDGLAERHYPWGWWNTEDSAQKG
jgi:hypothetical protein